MLSPTHQELRSELTAYEAYKSALRDNIFYMTWYYHASEALTSFLKLTVLFRNMITFDALNVSITVGFLLLVYVLYTSIWRLCLSPLARFPGPKLAALTLWYECYFDVFKQGGGMYIWKIDEMHKKYGNALSASL